MGGSGQIDWFDPSGGAQKYLTALENLGFSIDENDPIYKWRQEQTEKTVNRFLASRGQYDSRVAANALAEANMALQAEEVGRQSNELMNMYNMARGIGASQYGMLSDIASMGMGGAAASAAGAQQAGTNLANIYGAQSNALQQAALARGQSQAQMWSGLGAAPMNALSAYSYGKSAGLWGQPAGGYNSLYGGYGVNPAFYGQDYSTRYSTML